jgi:hypothetical protein
MEFRRYAHGGGCSFHAAKVIADKLQRDTHIHGKAGGPVLDRSLPDAIERNAAEVVTRANMRDISIDDLIGLRVQRV